MSAAAPADVPGVSLRKLPMIEPLTAFFWTSGEDGKLRIQRCTACGHYQHPPLALCTICHDESVAPAVVSGRGTVRTFTINYEAWLPGMVVPFVFTVIELAEQPELYMFSNVIAAVDTVAIGDPVEVFFERHEDVWLPLFKPVEGS